MFPDQIPYRPSPPLPNLPETGDSPVRRDFGDLTFVQGEELIPHIDVLRRIITAIFIVSATSSLQLTYRKNQGDF